MGKKNKNIGKLTATPEQAEKKMTVELESDAPSFIPLSADGDKSTDSGKSRMLKKKKRSTKRPRLIVRNLPYKATEEAVRKHFEKFGEITEVVLLRKPNKQLVGCGFVQFSQTQSAAKAIAHASGQPLMGRPIVVDWAVPKDQYLKKAEVPDSNVKIKKEIKEEDDGSSDDDDDNVNHRSFKNIEDSDEDEKESIAEDDQEEDDNDDDADGDYQSEDDKDDWKNRNKFSSANNRNQKPRIQSNDWKEGKTVFLRNLPFSIDNDRLQKFGEEFGPVAYARVCVDPSTDHSRGTGFIKFQDTECAEECIAQSQRKELILDNRTVDATRAISREDAKKEGTKKKVIKDNRNLFLLKEGLVTANSPAAEGMSASDMEKRIALERWKTKTLKDLTMFVSRVRLVVHNLPPTYSDSQLRALFMKHGGFKPRVTEARIMRNLRDVDARGVGRSKEYGFVTFSNHENALEALRNINNNPKIFGPNKRPIVSFSIEDKKMLNIRQRRQERSLMKNPTWKHYKEDNESEPEQKKNNKKKKNDKNDTKNVGKGSNNEKPQPGKHKRKISTPAEGPDAKILKPFMGAVAKPGEGGTIPLRKLHHQAELIKTKSRNEKKKNKQKAKPERIKRPKQEKVKKQEGKDEFSDMVNKYKASLAAAPAARSKWYD